MHLQQTDVGQLRHTLVVNLNSYHIVLVGSDGERLQEGVLVDEEFSQMAEDARNKKKNSLRLSQRLRGIGHAPKDFDYKKELEDRF